jgi:hypothetical protein
VKFAKRLLLAIAIIYLLPALASAGLWAMKDHPRGWNAARWSSSGMLPAASSDGQAAVYVFSAMTGGFKGSVASHAWVVLKKPGATSYDRYDKVGWGTPIRHNGYAADAYWYSNMPRQVVAIHGAEAEKLIPKIEKAIADYPYGKPGGYRIYPGPNSNTFVAHVLRSVPELGVVLPPDAVGRDYLPEGKLFAMDADGRDAHATLYGLIGVSAGLRSGLELHIMGLVAGIDVMRPAIKIPAIGRIGI